MGYYGIFGPNVPLWFSGEEFDAEPGFLPGLSRDRHGAHEHGGWMYGTQLDWEELLTNEKKALMVSDVARMLAIARNHSDVIHRNRCEAQILSVPMFPGGEGPVPYARWLRGKKAILVASSTGLVDRKVT